MTENTSTTASTEERPVHCCVVHPDVGGPCSEQAVLEVYGLNFCELHGEAAQAAVALQNANRRAAERAE